jgi:short-subunit dehydrogenase
MSTSFTTKYGPWAVVAGASEGLGAAFAASLAARGANLLLLARRAALLAEVAERLRSTANIEVRAEACDLGRPDLGGELEAMTRDIEVGVAVYNAAYAPIGEVLDQPLEELLRVVDVNVRGPLVFARTLAPAMVARRRGGLVLMSSMAGFQGAPRIATYASSKAFNIVLGESLWSELGPRGVDVVVSCAGAIRTPGYAKSAERLWILVAGGLADGDLFGHPVLVDEVPSDPPKRVLSVARRPLLALAQIEQKLLLRATRPDRAGRVVERRVERDYTRRPHAYPPRSVTRAAPRQEVRQAPSPPPGSLLGDDPRAGLEVAERTLDLLRRRPQIPRDLLREDVRVGQPGRVLERLILQPEQIEAAFVAGDQLVVAERAEAPLRVLLLVPERLALDAVLRIVRPTIGTPHTSPSAPTGKADSQSIVSPRLAIAASQNRG